MNYPNGKKPTQKQVKVKKDKLDLSISSANRGMNLENDINTSLEYYRDKKIAIIYKRPTPINIVKVDYSKGAKITNAYFEKQSTTDYNGIYKGKYIDFEAKTSKGKTSFPFSNIPIQQINHLKDVISLGAIAFFIVQLEAHDEVFLLDAKYVIELYESKERKSIPHSVIEEKGIEIKRGFRPRLEIIEAIEKAYF